MMNEVKNEHEVKSTDSWDEYYPDHVQRTESSLFRKTKHHLVHVLDTPCYICGTKENRESHHKFIEWAFANAVDWDKVKEDHPDFDWSTFKSAEDFVDSEYNALILCSKHHRAPNHGVHHMPYPNWLIQKYVRDDFILTPDQIKK